MNSNDNKEEESSNTITNDILDESLLRILDFSLESEGEEEGCSEKENKEEIQRKGDNQIQDIMRISNIKCNPDEYICYTDKKFSIRSVLSDDNVNIDESVGTSVFSNENDNSSSQKRRVNQENYINNFIENNKPVYNHNLLRNVSTSIGNQRIINKNQYSFQIENNRKKNQENPLKFSIYNQSNTNNIANISNLTDLFKFHKYEKNNQSLLNLNQKVYLPTNQSQSKNENHKFHKGNSNLMNSTNPSTLSTFSNQFNTLKSSDNPVSMSNSNLVMKLNNQNNYINTKGSIYCTNNSPVLNRNKNRNENNNSNTNLCQVTRIHSNFQITDFNKDEENKKKRMKFNLTQIKKEVEKNNNESNQIEANSQSKSYVDKEKANQLLNISSQSNSSLLNKYHNQNRPKKSTQSNSLSYYEGLSYKEITLLLPIMVKEQAGCRFLQNLIEKEEEMSVSSGFSDNFLLPYILNDILETMNNPFGNYLIQKMIDYMSENMISFIYGIVSKLIYNIHIHLDNEQYI